MHSPENVDAIAYIKQKLDELGGYSLFIKTCLENKADVTQCIDSINSDNDMQKIRSPGYSLNFLINKKEQIIIKLRIADNEPSDKKTITSGKLKYTSSYVFTSIYTKTKKILVNKLNFYYI